MSRKGIAWTVAVALSLMAGCGSPTVETNTSGDAPVVERPTAPAGEEYRADPANVVAMTGRPQLVEFFAYW